MSTNAKHTAGPWVVTDDVGTHVIRGADVEHTDGGAPYTFRDYVASTWGGPNEENARLIAAAPELLAALTAITEIYAEMRKELSLKYPMDGWSAETMSIDAARAAIAKATGSAA